MSGRQLRISGAALALALTGATGMIDAVAAGKAAEKTARLTIEVKVRGEDEWIGQGGDRGAGRFTHRYTLTTTVKSDGGLNSYNAKDPAHQQRQMDQAAHVAQAVLKAKGQKPPAKPISPEEMQAQLQAEYAACKGDQACLMRLAQKASDMTLQLYAQQAPAQSASVVEEEPAEVFLYYFGYENCGAQFHIVIDESGSGHYADVSGSVPFSHVRKADYRGNDLERSMICSTYNFVIDTEKQELWTDAFFIPGARGVSIYEDGLQGRTEGEGEMGLNAKVLEWVSEQIRHAPLSGTRRATLPLTGSKQTWVHFAATPKGKIDVEMTWKFEEI